MPSHLQITNPDAASDFQSVSMQAGDDILKDQLVVLTPSRKVYPARPAQGQALLTRTTDSPLITAINTLSKVTGVSQDYQQSQVERSYITPAGNVIIFGYDASSPRNYSWNMFSPTGVLLTSAVYTSTTANVGAYARRVDINRFMIIWVTDGSGAEQSTYRYIIYNNDGTLSQALTTVVLASGPIRKPSGSGEVQDQDFFATSDGYIVAAFSNANPSFNMVSWSLAGTVRAIATGFMFYTGQKPEMAESFGTVFCKVFEPSNGVTRFWRFKHSVAGSNPPDTLGQIAGSATPRICQPSILPMKNGNLLIVDKANTSPYIILWDGTNFNYLPLALSVGSPSSALLSIHDLGDNEAMVIIPVTNDGNFIAVRVDQTGKFRMSGVILLTFVGSTTYGWECARFTKTPDSIVFIFTDYNSSASPAGYYQRGCTVPLGWPFGGDLLASLGTIVNFTSGTIYQHRGHIEWFAQGELRSLVNSENNNYAQQIRTLNARKSGIVGVAAAAASKDAFVTLKTKGVFPLVSDQDFGDGFSFGSATQGVVGSGGKVVGRNAALSGLLS